jgi:8-oxo-dGTP pyrophosphatase MutT (NUDIX family)
MNLPIEMWDVLDKDGNITGRLHERGMMNDGDYHLVVHVWVINKNNEFLISKRTPNKPYPNMWECTGGSAVAGDDSITTALKEPKEELGIVLDPKNGHLFKRYKREYDNGSGDIIDVWLFRQEINITDIKFQPDETCDAMLAGKELINQMINDGTFIGRDIFPYLDELFNNSLH